MRLLVPIPKRKSKKSMNIINLSESLCLKASGYVAGHSWHSRRIM